MHVEGVVHVKRTGTNKEGGEGGQKLEVSSERTFWMTPCILWNTEAATGGVL